MALLLQTEKANHHHCNLLNAKGHDGDALKLDDARSPKLPPLTVPHSKERIKTIVNALVDCYVQPMDHSPNLIVSRIWYSLSERAGIQPWELYVVDNDESSSGDMNAGPPPLNYYCDKSPSY